MERLLASLETARAKRFYETSFDRAFGAHLLDDARREALRGTAQQRLDEAFAYPDARDMLTATYKETPNHAYEKATDFLFGGGGNTGIENMVAMAQRAVEGQMGRVKKAEPKDRMTEHAPGDAFDSGLALHASTHSLPHRTR